jgi:hypothetical protein
MFSFATFLEDLIIELNNLRTRPFEFAERLQKNSNFYKKSGLRVRKNAIPVKTREGLQGLMEAVEFLKGFSPVPPVSLSEGLRRAAQAHANDIGRLGTLDHVGSQDSSLQSRLDLFGKWGEIIGETLEFGSVSAFESIAELVVDDGVLARPHRCLLLNQRFKVVGAGIAFHELYETCVCIVFAGRFDQRENMPVVHFDDKRVDEDLDLGEWLDDAARMTCEVKVEEEAGRTTRKITRYWEMNDGSFQSTESFMRIN